MTSPLSVDDLKVKIFADGADLDSMLDLAANPRIKGFTTNPTLMRKAGIDDYSSFARRVLDKITNRPISFEVFADEFDEMHAQALEIASWGPNVNVKIPITNTRGESSAPLVADLSRQGVVVNVTAMFTLEQVHSIVDVLDAQTPAILSIFAGRIADAGRDPVPVMRDALECTHMGWGVSTVIGVAGAGEEIKTRPFNLVVGRRWQGTAFGGVKGRTELPGYVDRYMSGEIELDKMVTHTMPLEDINRAFDLMHSGESIRSVIIF